MLQGLSPCLVTTASESHKAHYVRPVIPAAVGPIARTASESHKAHYVRPISLLFTLLTSTASESHKAHYVRRITVIHLVDMISRL